ncbi:type IV secretion system DNA-binding domain-containing protein [Candidatus Berkelbacteria bacterium]|nr:type IV secretion system DNA-binding domain-containing protein [Candidatus Berkelbacteria bacterium]
MAWAGSKKGEPPSNLPLEGQVEENEVTYFGKTDFRNFRHKFGIKSIDRRLHMYILGKTGTGKSTLMQNMIIDDIYKGKGVAVVDPHGQLVRDVLEQIPSHRINDVLYFNPADREFPVGFNVLESVSPDLRNVAASGVVGIFKKLFAESWGPRLEYILRNTILALLEYPGSTLLGINRLLTDKNFRKRVVAKVQDPVIKDYFANEFEQYTPKFRTEAIAPIQNKVGQFLSASTIRNIVGQPQSSIDIRRIMDDGKIFLVDLSIGKIGEDSSALLGALLITQIQLTAMQRADVAESERRDFYLYVDEFQNFATDSFAVILSEARKYHLNLTLINQYIAQMPETVAAAIFGNVGTIVSFRVGPGDASGLVREFEPVFAANDLVNLANHHIYTKMAIDGVTRPAFSAVTLPPQSEPTGNIEKIIAVSRERYAKPRELVEKKIKDWTEDAQLKQAQEWRKSIDEPMDKEQGRVQGLQKEGAGSTPSQPKTDLPDFIVNASKKLKNKQGSGVGNSGRGQGRGRPESKEGKSRPAVNKSFSLNNLNKPTDKKTKKDVSWFDSGDEISLN